MSPKNSVLWTLIALAFASPTDASAFRTSADAEGFDGQAARWETGSVPFVLHANGVAGISAFELDAAIGAAAEAWEEAACGDVDLYGIGLDTRDATPGDGKNTIQWVTDWEARGFDPKAAGVTDVQYERRADDRYFIIEADVYLNAEDFAWSVAGDESTRSITTVLMHEFGHVLGLWHVCEPEAHADAPECDADSRDAPLMHPLYDSERSSLAEDDRAGLCFLYPAPDCDETGCPEGMECRSGICTSSCRPACGQDEVCVGNECREDRGFTSPPEDEMGSAGAAGAGGRSLLGDKCKTDSDCRSGICRDSSCTLECSDDDDCADLEGECNDGVCQASLSGIGERCSEADECLGGDCLAIDGNPPVCTRRCEADDECPVDWSCQLLEQRRVCAPPGPLTARGGGGCAVAAHTPPLELALLWSALSFGCAFSTYYRRAQRRRRLPHVMQGPSGRCGG